MQNPRWFDRLLADCEAVAGEENGQQPGPWRPCTHVATCHRPVDDLIARDWVAPVPAASVCSGDRRATVAVGTSRPMCTTVRSVHPPS